MKESEGESSAKSSSSSSLPLKPLSSQATSDLLALLLARGYFHGDSVDPIRADPLRNNPSQLDKDEETLRQHTEDDSACQIVLLAKGDQDASCCTFPVLTSKLMQELEKTGGRSDMKHLVAVLHLKDEMPLVRILEKQQQQQSATQYLFQWGEDMYSSLYLDRISQRIFDTLSLQEDPALAEDKVRGVKTTGFALVSDLATMDFHLPMDVTVAALTDRIPSAGFQVVTLDAGPAIVSESYMTQLQKDALKTFCDLQEPATVADVCHEHHWDVGLVATWVHEACHDKTLPGEIHGDTDAGIVSSGRALYTPHVHVQALRHAVDGFFAAQGFMSASKGAALGLSKSKMGEYIQESFVSTLHIDSINSDFLGRYHLKGFFSVVFSAVRPCRK